MKKSILLLIVFIAAAKIFSQGVIKITSGTTVKSKKAIYLVSNKMNIVNNGVLQLEENAGTLKIIGSTNDSISGTGTTIINRLELSKNNGSIFSLQQKINVSSECIFNNGSLNLDNYEMDLGTTGILINESELNRAYTTGVGFIKSSVVLNAPSNVNAGNLGAIITSSTNPGNTVIRRGHKVQPNVFGTHNSIQRYYDIVPANNTNLNATLRMKYFDAELNSINESGLNLWRSSDNINWIAVCDFTRNTTDNYVQSSGINSFARWTLSQVTPPLVVSIPNVYAVNPGGAVNTIYIGYGPSSATLTAQVTGGAPPYSYKWTAGSSAGPALNTTASYTVSPATTTTYYLNVKDAFGCTVAATTRQVNVIDIRCGAKLDKVTVCKFQNGNYSTVCVTSGTVAGLLSGGSYLGPCNTPVTLASPTTEIISQTKNAFNANVFPNPSENYFNLMVEGDSKEEVLIKVYNVSGAQVHLAKGNANRNYKFGEGWISGTYLVQVRQGNELKTIKLVKQ